jgi:hypothetical protein
MYLLSELNLLPALLLLALWTLGGWLITARTFNLPARERGLVSVGVGLVTGTWLANWLARFVPAGAAFWGAALLTVVIGLAMAWPLKRDIFPKEAFQPGPWILFIVFVIVFTLIGRGFAFFDDHQNLAPVSIMATGDIPPHFSYNPDLRFGYHYFLLLVAAQFVRLAGAGPWTALDLARGLTLALTLAYGGLVALRITRSKLAQSLSMVFMAFAGGARWLFLLLPISLQHQLSSGVQLIGSGADTGPNLITAIYKYWKIEGLGPLPFPFMFGSGLDPSFSMFHNGWGTSAITMVLLLMLLAGSQWLHADESEPQIPDRLRRFGYLPIVILLASLALANEVTFAFLYFGLAFAALAWIIQKRSLRLPRSLWLWVGLMFVGGVLALVQGGMFTEVTRGWLERQTSSADSTYFRVGFALGLPTVLSAHLGYLSMLNPLQWVAILGETGLAVFALPIVLKQLPAFSRDENWLEAAWIGSIIVSLLMVFVQYTGNAGPTAASRMQAHFLTVVKIYAVPLLWVWARERSENIKTAVFAWGLATIFSGISLFGLQMAAMPNPVYAIYLNQLDAQMFTRQWDKLAPHTMVFDPTYPRAATIFGRPIRSSKTMGETLPEWNLLDTNPDPYKLKAAGYDYLYVDLKYLNKYAGVIKQDCARLVDKVEDKHGSNLVDARYLFRVTECVSASSRSSPEALTQK